MRLEWDAVKNRSNLAKHGLDFADAESVFAGPCVTFVDDRLDYGEERFTTLGLLAGTAGSDSPCPAWRNDAHHLDEEGESA
jgi:uncharacterized DUF497 family protein